MHMDNLDDINGWLIAVLPLLASAAGFVWACALTLRAMGYLTNKESVSPAARFCARMSRRRAGQAAIVLFCSGCLCLVIGIDWCRSVPSSGSRSDAISGEISEELEELSEKLEDTMHTADDLVEESHREAVANGSREQWCRAIVRSVGEGDGATILTALDRATDLPTRLALLCFFERISEMELGIRLDSQLTEEELSAKIGEAKRRWNSRGP